MAGKVCCERIDGHATIAVEVWGGCGYGLGIATVEEGEVGWED
jgi:hypothetical protein